MAGEVHRQTRRNQRQHQRQQAPTPDAATAGFDVAINRSRRQRDAPPRSEPRRPPRKSTACPERVKRSSFSGDWTAPAIIRSFPSFRHRAFGRAEFLFESDQIKSAGLQHGRTLAIRRSSPRSAPDRTTRHRPCNGAVPHAGEPKLPASIIDSQLVIRRRVSLK